MTVLRRRRAREKWQLLPSNLRRILGRINLGFREEACVEALGPVI